MTDHPLSLVKKPWYKDGLRFGCTECGQCCTGSPGYIWVSDEEIQTIAQHLRLGIQEFADRYLKRVGDRFSLREHSAKFDCVFLNGKKCGIYQVRPKQCRTFPWWPGFLENAESWQAAAKYCEGIRDDAPIVPLEQIEAHLNSHSE